MSALQAKRSVAVLASGLLWASTLAWSGDTQLQIFMPLNRTAYQTNETIHLAVTRSAAGALPEGDLSLTLSGEDGGKLAFTFHLAAVAGTGGEARSVEHLQVNGWLLRPGHYTVEALFGGEAAGAVKTEIDVCSHVRKSTFKLADWGCGAAGPEQAVMGEDSMGFNVLLASYGGISPDDMIRGGLDYMRCCTMGGAHQMDIRMECDWSDPYVLNAANARVSREAFAARLNSNAIGVHFYDEPGLTWWKHRKTGEMTSFNIPSQDRAYKSAFGVDAPQYCDINPDDPKDFASWLHMNRWKESFVEAAWKHAAFAVREVRADFLPANQTVYAWYAYADGYYFNVGRCFPVICGHGGYDDGGLLYFNPSLYFEMGRMRDLAKPNWYLPTWFSGMPSPLFRLEQYLSFMGNLQGMMKPPDMHIHRPSQTMATANGIVESNKLMARLGTVFTTMPVTRPEVAMLYSLSQALAAECRDMKKPNSQNVAAYEGGGHTHTKIAMAYMAGQLAHVPFQPIVEEDVLDGTLAAHHKAVFLPGINYLDPKVVAVLEAFVASGGAVLVSDDSQVQIKGAVKLGVSVDTTLPETLNRLWREGKMEEIWRLSVMGNYFVAVAPLAKALTAKYQQLGIKPVFECDNPQVVISRQALGDVEYLFAANASYDEKTAGARSMKPATAAISLAADGCGVYDAMTGGPVAELKAQDKILSGPIRFGPGQMRVFARTARPIGGVQALTPTLFRDYTVAQNPVRLDVAASVVDGSGRVLCGSIPLLIRVLDPLGVTRFELYRATSQGVCQVSLPLGVNEAAGQWKVVVRELLANKEASAPFTYQPPAQCGGVAGTVPRAINFGNDRENIFRFFALFKEVTIVKGSSDYNATAAERLAEVLKPWDVRAKIVAAAEVNKPRPISEEEAPAWCGLEPGRVQAPGRLKPGEKNGIAQVGFDVRGPVVLLGTPEDNPLIKFLLDARFLPYKPEKAKFPGPGRGLLAWQRDGVGYWQESITLIAHDEAGINEAVGTLYEIAAGLDPLMPWNPPSSAAVTPATKAPTPPAEARVAWQVAFPDRALELKVQANRNVVVLTQDGTLAALDPTGKAVWQKTVDCGDSLRFGASDDGNVLAVGAGHHLVVFDGGGEQHGDVPFEFDLPGVRGGKKEISPITAVAVSPDGKNVVAAAANGRLLLVDNQGKTTWALGGVTAEELAKCEADLKTWEAGGKKGPQPKRPVPAPYLMAEFGQDGNTLLAITKDQGHVISVADGKIGEKLGGIAPVFKPVGVGENLLVTDGRERLALVSLAQGKVLGELRCTQSVPAPGKKPGEKQVIKDTAASAALLKETLVVGTEFDGTVRALKDVKGNLEEQTSWSFKTPLRVTKKIAAGDGLLAVAYWGGTLRVLDATGALKFGQTFPQDIAELACSGKLVIVATADGKITALEGK